jgi:hypothetical protein
MENWDLCQELEIRFTIEDFIINRRIYGNYSILT